MDHSPNEAEAHHLRELLSRYHFEPVPIRLTATMLEKSIIDAGAALRALLARSGLASYEFIPQGEDGKVVLQLPIITAHTVEVVPCSLYRPRTKQGDPRIWPNRLKQFAKAGDLLVFAFHDSQLTLLVIGNDLGALLELAGHRLPPLHGSLAKLDEIRRAIGSIQGSWHRTLRPGPTGVGYTLESLLGLEANTRRDTDFDGIELKAYRRGAERGAGKLVTLFSQVPDRWHVPLRGLDLLRDHGYHDAKTGRLQLYCSVVASPNSLGWRLGLVADRDEIDLLHGHDAKAGYMLRTLDLRLKEKHPATLFVRASTRGAGQSEEFRYEEVTLYRQPSLANLITLLEADRLGLDLTLSLEGDRARDHGYLWRIREASIPELFAYREQLLTWKG
ncbi:MAG: MvaI/BcnI family restriction endonuclease [Gemmatimonadales bacterium]|nr:MvaI/BcnI family restriction endonuclease [Gemmatimonadales bacterium]